MITKIGTLPFSPHQKLPPTFFVESEITVCGDTSLEVFDGKC